MSFFDLRLALGWLFVTLGALLIIAGIRAAPTSEAVSLGIPINLIWGAVMIAFGLLCLWFASRHARKRRRRSERVRLGLQKE
jgi:TRAP-type C4-dicarboxylate transport system permease small subunit